MRKIIVLGILIPSLLILAYCVAGVASSHAGDMACPLSVAAGSACIKEMQMLPSGTLLQIFIPLQFVFVVLFLAVAHAVVPFMVSRAQTVRHRYRERHWQATRPHIFYSFYKWLNARMRKVGDSFALRAFVAHALS